MVELIDKRHFTALSELDPNEVISRTHCTFDSGKNCYTLPVWTGSCAIYPGRAEVEWQAGSSVLHEYFSLFAVHYLLSAKDIQPAGQWISEKDMAGGATFFRGPHAIPTQLITEKVENSCDRFHQLCRDYNGSPLAMADAAAVFSITSRIPVAVLYWAGDDEFPAEAKLLFDKTLPDHFALDIVFALAVGITEELSRS
ncbi:DUF3786 domain-containing protein [Desulfopila aestuarii]|uniref:DUF3786 domain-containing protein n=1 Tax=Desulfopila aestuarii DSM 18488 TaxID=1121416 RepID=A0A1M7Y9J3_9BACT|nr:DUF3786 domain-containing protein [Desulfopila aestuarii]SHO49304.1 protein of unknown function [Desulfopila aestuarii DSM 18488]